ncbi:deubiquitinase OTUD6B isoform X3 [Hydra vulgaris]|uniref:Deubiquitinase OTUD6B isoform X3 n=2 Tax=Hydra vulgaris TaxID=6087 RepID=A0ABM4DJJ4_HYDVU
MDKDELYQRQKLEQSELQAKILSMKRNASKADKKQKQQANITAARLQAELDEKHSKELEQFCQENKPCDMADSIGLISLESNEASNVKISKAQKRRDKKEASNRELNIRITNGEKEAVNHSRNIEASQFEKLLFERNLKIIEINPDGNCLYNSIAFLFNGSTTEDGMLQLRERTSSYMLEHIEDFLPFSTNNVTGDIMEEDEYTKYCHDIRYTNLWGGQLELRAISQIYKQPIEILQASNPPLMIGEEYDKQPIRISYHRHQYGLGEHYNAVVSVT